MPRRAFTLIELLMPNRRFGRGVRKNGFTLIELLIVISIIGVLVTLVAVTVQPIQKKSRDAKRKSDLNLFLSALDLFKTDFKLYPNHTFYLGKNPDQGSSVSNFDLAADITSCQGLTNGGDPSNFAVRTDFVTTENNYNNAILKPGFVATNHFLLCLKYIDRLVVDPVAGQSQNGYKFAVAYDYVDVLVSARLENTNDQDAKTLFNPTVPKRYYIGSGATVRHLDDDSDSQTNAPNAPNQFFYSAFSDAGNIARARRYPNRFGWLPAVQASGRVIDNGRYLYQCNGKNVAQDITRNDRSLTSNQPIVFQNGAWRANGAACKNEDASLDDIQAW